MAWLRNNNRSRLTEPDYDSKGKVHAIINYSESSHMVQTERAFGVLRVNDDHYKLHSPPPRVNVLKGANVEDISHFPPGMAYLGSPKKPGEFSPKDGRSSNPLARVRRSPFSWDDDHSSADESDDDYKRPTNYKDDDDWNARSEGSYSPRVVRPNHVYDVDYHKESPEGTFSSPPKKYTYHGTANNRVSPSQSRPEGDHIQSPRANWHPSFEPTSGGHPYYNSTSPKTDKQYERPIGPSPLIRTKPVESDHNGCKTVMTSPRRYEIANHIKPVQERPMRRIDKRQQVIGRRGDAKPYEGEAVNEQIYREEYKRTIDCREAASKYNGIYVPS